jgi:hypothetical protein
MVNSKQTSAKAATAAAKVLNDGRTAKHPKPLLKCFISKTFQEN